MHPAYALLFSFLLLPTAAPAEPGTRDPRINQRQHNQHHRVAQGVRSGELSKAEASALREERRTIRDKERAYKSDGSLSKDERQDLRSDMRTSSRDIHAQKHDGEKRP